jgi:hypothetical protein
MQTLVDLLFFFYNVDLFSHSLLSGTRCMFLKVVTFCCPRSSMHACPRQRKQLRQKSLGKDTYIGTAWFWETRRRGRRRLHARPATLQKEKSGRTYCTCRQPEAGAHRRRRRFFHFIGRLAGCQVRPRMLAASWRSRRCRLYLLRLGGRCLHRLDRGNVDPENRRPGSMQINRFARFPCHELNSWLGPGRAIMHADAVILLEKDLNNAHVF